MSHRGQNTAANTFQKWNGSKWVQTSMGLASAVESFPVGIANGSDIIWGGAGGGFGDLYCGILIPTADVSVENGAFWSTQAPGGGGGAAVGIYDAAGLLLRRTAIQVGHPVGITTAAWASGGALELTAGTPYFLAMYSNMNGGAYLRQSPAATPPAGSVVGFSVPNSGSLDASGFPADVSGYFGNLTSIRFWNFAKA